MSRGLGECSYLHTGSEAHGGAFCDLAEISRENNSKFNKNTAGDKKCPEPVEVTELFVMRPV